MADIGIETPEERAVFERMREAVYPFDDVEAICRSMAQEPDNWDVCRREVWNRVWKKAFGVPEDDSMPITRRYDNGKWVAVFTPEQGQRIRNAYMRMIKKKWLSSFGLIT